MAYNIAPSKQDLLVSGTNIKTINGSSLLGSGDLTISTLPSQTGNQYKVLVTDGSAASWQFAGLGDGSFGTNNVILGRSKPTSFTTANSNILINTSSTNTITSANNNVIIGTNAGNAVTSAINQIFIGPNAGLAVTTSGTSSPGSANIAIGINAFSANTTNGGGNICIGGNTANAAIGNYNVMVGPFAGNGNIIGSYTVQLGLRVSAMGDNSIAIGSQANAQSYLSAICLGADSQVLGNYGIALGQYASASANNFALGSSIHVINTLYLGRGEATQTTANAVKIQTMRGGGTDKDLSAGTLTLAGAQGTGTGIGGDVIISTAPAAGVSGNSLNAHVERFRCKAATEVVVNDTGVDFDFRVEGDTDANLLFVDAGTDKVGIGTATPSEKLEVNGNILASEVAVANYKLSPKVHDEGTEPGNFTINWANSPVQLVELNGTTNAVVTLSNPVTGGAYALKITQGATPGTIDFTAGSFANVKWPGGTPPTLSGTTGDIDLINLLYIGTTYYATFALDFA